MVDRFSGSANDENLNNFFNIGFTGRLFKKKKKSHAYVCQNSCVFHRVIGEI